MKVFDVRTTVDLVKLLVFIVVTNSSNRYAASSGPGVASGWNCTEKAGISR